MQLKFIFTHFHREDEVTSWTESVCLWISTPRSGVRGSPTGKAGNPPLCPTSAHHPLWSFCLMLRTFLSPSPSLRLSESMWHFILLYSPRLQDVISNFVKTKSFLSLEDNFVKFGSSGASKVVVPLKLAASWIEHLESGSSLVQLLIISTK